MGLLIRGSGNLEQVIRTILFAGNPANAEPLEPFCLTENPIAPVAGVFMTEPGIVGRHEHVDNTEAVVLDAHRALAVGDREFQAHGNGRPLGLRGTVRRNRLHVAEGAVAFGRCQNGGNAGLARFGTVRAIGLYRSQNEWRMRAATGHARKWKGQFANGFADAADHCLCQKVALFSLLRTKGDRA